VRTLAHPRDLAEIRERLRRLRPTLTARWGRMSAHQMVCHLADGFRMMSGRKRVRPMRGRLPPVAMKLLALYVPLRWPPGVQTSRELDQEIEGTRPGDWTADLATLETLVEGATAPPPSGARQPHPVFGRMSEAAWLRWGYLHVDHHLRQFGL